MSKKPRLRGKEQSKRKIFKLKSSLPRYGLVFSVQKAVLLNVVHDIQTESFQRQGVARLQIPTDNTD